MLDQLEATLSPSRQPHSHLGSLANGRHRARRNARVGAGGSRTSRTHYERRLVRRRALRLAICMDTTGRPGVRALSQLGHERRRSPVQTYPSPGHYDFVGMSGQNESDAEELGRLQADLVARDEEVEQLRVAAASAEREITDLRDLAQRESEQIDQLQEDAVASQRIERAQRALIAELRAEVGEEERAELELGARLRAAELELVDLRAIRDALLPPMLVQREGMSIAAEVIPAEPYIGGDFFFVGDGPRGTVVAAVGDVVGKGLQAARRSAFTRTVLASVAAFSDDPGRLLQWVNVALVERIGESAEFVTAACVTYDPGTRVLRFASAGHPPALRLESGDELTAERTGAALGLAREVDCQERAERLGPGDGVLLYTDGLVEARGVGSRYGTDRLAAALRHGKRLAPPEILELLKRDLREFAGERINDDVCLLALRGE